MRKHTVRSLAVAVILGLAFSVAVAGDAVKPLPAHITAHISVKSPAQLLAAVDAYVATATQGTRYYLPQGFVTMMAQMNVPIPMDAWGSSQDTHIVFIATGKESWGTVVVLNAADPAVFLRALDAGGVEVADSTGLEDDEEGWDVSLLEFPNGVEMVLANLGDGRLALAEEIGHIETVLKDWRPEHETDADVVLRISNNPNREMYVGQAVAMLRNTKEKTLKEMAAAGIPPEMAANLFALAEKYLPKAAAEADALEGGLAQLRIKDARLVLEIGGKFASSSLLGEVVEHLAKAPALVNELEANVPDNAVSYAVYAPVKTILPRAEERITGFNGNVYGVLSPELAERARKSSADFFAASPGGAVVATFVTSSGQYNVCLSQTGNPAAFLQSSLDGIALFNDAWEKGVGNPDYGMRLESRELVIDGEKYVEIHPVFANPDVFRRLLGSLNDSAGVMQANFEKIEKLRLFLGTGSGLGMMAVGEIDETEFRTVLPMLKGKADKPWSGRKALGALREELGDLQANLGFVDANGAFLMVITQLARELGMGESAGYRKALEKTVARLEKKEAMLGVGLGESSGMLSVRGAVPADAINAFLLLYEMFDELRGIDDEDSAPDSEMEDDEGEDEDEDEIILLEGDDTV